ncbi:zona pellucida sperm-binding protein 3-like [Syngnathus typhle]|uniref:zona pellucida sperm-binding protein 3-like n=1 Tax=Syngnathus typhle TaxID=161592 RepID=UPI002A69CBDF|nr:zona pellucida sperm-binding protein 3-like [Syngnathus typhle]
MKKLAPRCILFVLLALLGQSRRRSHLLAYDIGGPGLSVQAQPLQDAPKTLLVKCHSDSMELVLQRDLFLTGLLVEPEHLRLGSEPARGSGGSCRARATADGGATLTLWADLMDCGTLLSSTRDKLIYSNVLVYTPEPSSDGLRRLDAVTIPVECHFDKRYSVAGISLHPAWIPSVLVVAAEGGIDFKLRLVTDDWMFERRSRTYFLGEPMHMEVSAAVRKHKPLRVYVEHCAATADPDPYSAIRYDFIERNGCLTDAFHTNSSSRFLPRLVEHTLLFQLEAFRFHHQPNSQVYITCWLKAVPDSVAGPSQNRACSFIDNGWWSAGGEHTKCGTCSPLWATTTRATDIRLAANGAENVAPDKVQQATSSHLHAHPEMSQQSTSGVKMESDYKLMRVVQLGPLTVE